MNWKSALLREGVNETPFINEYESDGAARMAAGAYLGQFAASTAWDCGATTTITHVGRNAFQAVSVAADREPVTAWAVFDDPSEYSFQLEFDHAQGVVFVSSIGDMRGEHFGTTKSRFMDIVSRLRRLLAEDRIRELATKKFGPMIAAKSIQWRMTGADKQGVKS